MSIKISTFKLGRMSNLNSLNHSNELFHLDRDSQESTFRDEQLSGSEVISIPSKKAELRAYCFRFRASSFPRQVRVLFRH
jgi:hypothetical protein